MPVGQLWQDRHIQNLLTVMPAACQLQILVLLHSARKHLYLDTQPDRSFLNLGRVSSGVHDTMDCCQHLQQQQPCIRCRLHSNMHFFIQNFTEVPSPKGMLDHIQSWAFLGAIGQHDRTCQQQPWKCGTISVQTRPSPRLLHAYPES